VSAEEVDCFGEGKKNVKLCLPKISVTGPFAYLQRYIFYINILLRNRNWAGENFKQPHPAQTGNWRKHKLGNVLSDRLLHIGFDDSEHSDKSFVCAVVCAGEDFIDNEGKVRLWTESRMIFIT
jgi:hypothetical protein